METTEEKPKWSKDLLVMFLFISVFYGFSLSEIAGNVLFVKRIGSEFLPYTYIIDAILSAVVVFFVASYISRVKITNLISIATGIGLIGIILLLFAIQQNYLLSYAAFLIFIQQLYPVLTTILIWSLALKLCTPFEAKRSFGLYSLGGSLGGIFAGITSSILSETFGTEILIPIILISLVLTLIFTVLIGYQNQSLLNISPEELEAAKQSTYRDSYRAGKEAYKNSKLAKLLALALIIFAVLHWIAEYEFQKILGDTFNEDQFTFINGFVSIIENFLLIIIFLFVQHRILRRLGTLKTLAFSPAFIFIPFLLLLLFPLAMFAIILNITIKTIDFSTFSNSVRLIFTALPNKVRSSITTFIKANSQSAGTLIAGIGLAVLTRFINNFWIIIAALILIVAMIVLVLFIKTEYLKQLINNLESDDVNDIYGAIENFAEPAYQKVGVHELMKMLNKEELQPETIRKIIFALGKIDNVSVIPHLLNLFKTSDITVKYSIIEAIHGFSNLNQRLQELPWTRLNIIETYKNIFLKEESPEIKIFILQHLKDFDPEHVIQFLKEAINNKNPQIQNQAINAMQYFQDRGTIKYIKPFLIKENPETQASAIIALWQFKEIRPELLKKFIQLQQSTDKLSIIAALKVIAKLKFTWEKRYAEELLQNPEEEVVAMAAFTLTKIESTKGIRIVLQQLISKGPFSIQIARNFKELPRKMQNYILKTVLTLHQESQEIFVQNLKDTYLNFTKEIEFLRGNEKRLARL